MIRYISIALSVAPTQHWQYVPSDGGKCHTLDTNPLYPLAPIR